jgi:hypothetical protein
MRARLLHGLQSFSSAQADYRAVRIDDRKLGKPRMRSMSHAVYVIIKERGVSRLMQGLVPTTVSTSFKDITTLRFRITTSF